MREAFEQAILEDPDEVSNYAAYADWLSDENDPRGELIQVQLALEDESHSPQQRKKLKAREKALLKSHSRQWLGTLAPFILDNRDGLIVGEANCQYQFIRGFLRKLHILKLGYFLAIALTNEPQAQWLLDLTVEDNAYTFEYEDEGEEVWLELPNDENYLSYETLIESPYLRSLRRLQIGQDWSGEGDPYSGVFDRADELVARMPRLEELHLFQRGVRLKELFSLESLSHLRMLRVYHVGSPYEGEERDYAYPIEALANNAAFANLTHLAFHPHHEESWSLGQPPSFLPLEKLEEILHSKHLVNLQHLQWRLSDMGDNGCQAIVDSGILKRLKVLDLRHGCITDEGAKILASCPDLSHLERLDIGRNAMTRRGLEVLKGTGRAIADTGGQQTPEDLEDYQYLREGEFE